MSAELSLQPRPFPPLPRPMATNVACHLDHAGPGPEEWCFSLRGFICLWLVLEPGEQLFTSTHLPVVFLGAVVSCKEVTFVPFLISPGGVPGSQVACPRCARNPFSSLRLFGANPRGRRRLPHFTEARIEAQRGLALTTQSLSPPLESWRWPEEGGCISFVPPRPLHPLPRPPSGVPVEMARALKNRCSAWPDATWPPEPGCPLPPPLASRGRQEFEGLQVSARPAGESSSPWCQPEPLFLRKWRDLSVRLGTQKS